MMKLYHFPTSPYVRKVMILLHETGQLDDVELVTGTTSPVAPNAALESVNPLKKLPALVRPEGPTLYDSRVICAFLDDRAAAGLYGKGPRRWDLLTLEATADGMMDAALLMTYEVRLRPEDKRWNDWPDAQWAKIISAIAALEAKWMSHLTGPLNIGQIAVACALGYLDLRHDARGWRQSGTALASWHAEFAERESYRATVPPEGG